MWAYYGAILSLDIYHNTPPHSPTPLPPQKKILIFLNLVKKSNLVNLIKFQKLFILKFMIFRSPPPSKKKTVSTF